VLDYARALQRVVEPPALSWPNMIRQAVTRYRQIRHPSAGGVPVAEQKTGG
jgi:hypothetical protein